MKKYNMQTITKVKKFLSQGRNQEQISQLTGMKLPSVRYYALNNRKRPTITVNAKTVTEPTIETTQALVTATANILADKIFQRLFK